MEMSLKDKVTDWIRLVFVLPDRERCHSGDSGVRALGRYCWWKKSGQPVDRQLISLLFTGFYTSQVVSRISSITSITTWWFSMSGHQERVFSDRIFLSNLRSHCLSSAPTSQHVRSSSERMSPDVADESFPRMKPHEGYFHWQLWC